MEYLQTVNHDLQGIKKLLLFSQNENFSSVAVYSLFRDSCLMLYEVVKVLETEGILIERFSTFKHIEMIRHKIKASQGKNNRSVFKDSLNIHFDLFGEDIDNLGFYLDRGKLIGSTFYITYVYSGTPFFNSIKSGEIIKEFSKEVGKDVASIINTIGQPLNMSSKMTIKSNEDSYELKDIWHKRIFTKDITLNVFIMRLLIIQNEISSCLWIEKHLDYKGEEVSLDKYILLRLSSIKFYQMMESLIDLKKRSPEHYTILNLTSLDGLLLRYETNMKTEIKKLRNMLHYNNKGINFYDYFIHEIEKDKEYAENLLKIMLVEFFLVIRDVISDSLSISSIDSMGDWEKIRRRIITKVKHTTK